MAGFVMFILLLLAMASYSDANFCICKTGLSDSVLQKSIDYACGNGADCTQIQQNGTCYNPNTVLDHCNYAVNSYYQRKPQTVGSCDFSGSATVSQNAPATSSGSGCVYLSGPSTGGIPTTGTPPSGGTSTIGTPNSGGTPTIGTPNAGGTPPNFGGTPNNGGTTVPGSPMTPTFGLGPTGFPSTDISGGVKFIGQKVPFMVVSITVILINGLICAGI